MRRASNGRRGEHERHLLAIRRFRSDRAPADFLFIEGGPTAQLDAVLFRGSQTCARALNDKGTFELGECGHDMQYEAPARALGINGIGKRAEVDAALAKVGNRLDQVG